MTSDSMKEAIHILKLQVHRVMLENRLLRAASKEQRQLNGRLRVELQELKAIDTCTNVCCTSPDTHGYGRIKRGRYNGTY